MECDFFDNSIYIVEERRLEFKYYSVELQNSCERWFDFMLWLTIQNKSSTKQLKLGYLGDFHCQICKIVWS